jgi:hypothetical protein
MGLPHPPVLLIQLKGHSRRIKPFSASLLRSFKLESSISAHSQMDENLGGEEFLVKHAVERGDRW